MWENTIKHNDRVQEKVLSTTGKKTEAQKGDLGTEVWNVVLNRQSGQATPCKED